MKKWSENELMKCVKLLNDGKQYHEISRIIGRTPKSIKLKLNRNGYYCINKNLNEVITCLNCGDEFESLISENRKFCSSSCSATFNNKSRSNKSEFICLNCGSVINNKDKHKPIYCNHNCQHEHKRKEIFKKIEDGDTSFNHKQYKKYLIHKHGEKCMECGWNEKNPVTGNIPIELEHIDGNSTNNSLENLKLLCPNCHSLTPTYKALNYGKGRHKRRERYKNNKSY